MNTRITLDEPTEHAVRAWTQRHSGTWTDADEAALQAWRDADATHGDAYDRVARLWSLTGQIPRLSPSHARARSRFRPYPLLAASCAALLVAALILPAWRAGKAWLNGVPERWMAERGAPKTLVLKDGTRVMLDADSELVAQLGARTRRVTLVRGEALFSVIHDTSRPFEVDAGPGRIADFGTRFDVEHMHGSVRIAVLEGRVGVATAHGEMSLGAGSGGGYDGAGLLLPVQAVDDSAQWGDGRRHFNAEPLCDVVDRLARYHPVTFSFSDSQLKQLRLSGTFKMDDLALFLRTLATALPVEARWLSPERVEITSRPSAPNPHSADD